MSAAHTGGGDTSGGADAGGGADTGGRADTGGAAHTGGGDTRGRADTGGAGGTAALERWLDARNLGSGPTALEPLGDGHSNPTFVVHRPPDRWVLRRAPHGPLAPSTHDVLREAAWMRALRPAGIPVPVVVDGSDDPAIVGTPFFVMELVEGFVPGPGSGAIPEAVDQPDGRRSIVEAFVDALAALHRVPADLPGLARFHRPGNYLERQIERFSGLWERNRTRSLPDVDDLTGWLRSNIPATLRVGVVHGDARPGNAVFRPRADGRAELVGLLDWEMAAIGDPLADVGYLLATWAEGTDPHDPLFDVSIWTRAPGYPTREEIATRYAELTGTSMAELRFYVVLALWKAVILMEGNLRRYLDGQADNPYFETYVDGLPPIADRGRRLTEQS